MLRELELYSKDEEHPSTELSRAVMWSDFFKVIKYCSEHLGKRGRRVHDFPNSFIQNIFAPRIVCKGLHCDSDAKESACNVGDPGWIPGSGRSPGEGNGNHSSILAWRIPWTEDPGRLQSMGSQRVGHD